MKLTRSHETDDSDVGLVPMINVVFLLLVFFMVAGAIAPAAPVDIQPPTSERSLGAPTSIRVVHLSADGALTLDDVPVTRGELIAAMSNAVNEIEGADEAPEHHPPNRIDGSADRSVPSLALRADGQVSFLLLRQTIEALRRAGIYQLELITGPAVDTES